LEWYRGWYHCVVRVVLDSNVLVAAFRSRRGASYEVLRLLDGGKFEVAVSVPLVFEYEATLLRHASELALAPTEAIALVDYFCAKGHRQEVHFLWRPTLVDPRDEFVLELAVASGAEAIVTHNVNDFRGVDRFGVEALTPREFLQRLGGSK
jgi:putative PIN family toxin of toxin-antitoxin system